MADQLAADRAHTHQRDEVAERHRCAEDVDRDDVSELGDQVAVLFEPSTRTWIGVDELICGDGTAADESGGPHRHGAIRQHDDHVRGETDGQHPHAGDVAIDEGETGQHGERHTEERPLHVGRELSERQLEERSRGHHHWEHDHRRTEVPAMRPSDGTDGGADQAGHEDGEHVGRR